MILIIFFSLSISQTILPFSYIHRMNSSKQSSFSIPFSSSKWSHIDRRFSITSILTSFSFSHQTLLFIKHISSFIHSFPSSIIFNHLISFHFYPHFSHLSIHIQTLSFHSSSLKLITHSILFLITPIFTNTHHFSFFIPLFIQSFHLITLFQITTPYSILVVFLSQHSSFLVISHKHSILHSILQHSSFHHLSHLIINNHLSIRFIILKTQLHQHSVILSHHYSNSFFLSILHIHLHSHSSLLSFQHHHHLSIPSLTSFNWFNTVFT